MWKRAGQRAGRFIVAVSIATAGLFPFSVQAYEGLFNPFAYLSIQPLRQKVDFFGGIDAAKATTFTWAGATYAPAGTLSEDGWRVRFMGGAGRYSYASSVVPGGINDANLFSAELLGGYRRTFDGIFGTRIYVGAFAGVFYEDQILQLADPFNAAQGSEIGLKVSLEIYLRAWQHYIVTGFASAATVHDKYHGKAMLLRELNEQWAIGGEIATMGDARYSEYRAGLAASFSWQHRLFTLSVGALDNSGRGSGAYTTFSLYAPF